MSLTVLTSSKMPSARERRRGESTVSVRKGAACCSMSPWLRTDFLLSQALSLGPICQRDCRPSRRAPSRRLYPDESLDCVAGHLKGIS